jgi:D-arginine dehydrogenase
LSRIAEAAVLGLPFPEDAAAAGLSFATFSPERLSA